MQARKDARPWQDRFQSPISPTKVLRLRLQTHTIKQNLQTPHRKETELILAMMPYVMLAELTAAALCRINSHQTYLNVFLQTAWHAHCVPTCYSYLDTTRGKINIFSILISSSPGNWKYFTSCKGKKQQSSNKPTQDAEDMAGLCFPEKAPVNPPLCYLLMMNRVWFLISKTY